MSKQIKRTNDGPSDPVENRKRKLAGILEDSDSKECLTPSKRLTRSSTGTPLKQADEAKKEEDYYSMFNREKYRRGKKSNRGDNDEVQEFYGPLGLPPKLMEISEYPETGKINSYSKTSYLKDITHILHGTDEFELIRDSQFGSVFGISARKGALSGRLLHNMLCRLLLTRKRHELWFLFGNRPIRFSLREFAIVTGLNCGQFPPEREIKALKKMAKNDDAYWFDLFGDDLSEGLITQIVERLKTDTTLPRSQRMSRARRLRLCLVVLVDGILCCKNSATVKASPFTVQMVKNVEKFLDFPWGRHSFEKTIEMVRIGSKSCKDVDQLLSKLNSQVNVAVKGFTVSFQLVFFRAIPALTQFLTTKGAEIDFADPDLKDIDANREFSNERLAQLNDDPETDVYSIIDYGRSPNCGDVTWKDELFDSAVERMISRIDDGYVFKELDWVKAESFSPPPPAPLHPMAEKERLPKREAPVKAVKRETRSRKATKITKKVAVKSKTKAKRPTKEDVQIMDHNLDPIESLVDKVVKQCEKSLLEKLGVASEVIAAEHSREVHNQLVAELKQNPLIVYKEEKHHGKEKVDVSSDSETQDHQVYVSEEDSDEDAKLSRSKPRTLNIDLKEHGSSYFPSEHTPQEVNKDTSLSTRKPLSLKIKLKEHGSPIFQHESPNFLPDQTADEVLTGCLKDLKEGEMVGKSPKDLNERVMADKSRTEEIFSPKDARPEDFTAFDRELEEHTMLQEENIVTEEIVDPNADEEIDFRVPEPPVFDTVMQNQDEKTDLGTKTEQVEINLGSPKTKESKNQGTGNTMKAVEGDAEGTLDVSPSSYLRMDDCEDVGDAQGPAAPEGSSHQKDLPKEPAKMAQGAVLALPAKHTLKKPRKLPREKPPSAPAMTTRSMDQNQQMSAEILGLGPLNNRLFMALGEAIEEYLQDSYYINGAVVPRTIFEQIYTPSNFVSTDAMNLMIESVWSRLESSLVKKGIMFLDAHFIGLVLKDHLRFSTERKYDTFPWNNTIKNIVQGRNKKRSGPSAWFVDVHKIYVPMNWPKAKHWVGICICLNSGSVTVLDCFQDLTSDAKLVQVMAELLSILPPMLADLAPQGSRIPVPQRFSLKRPKDVYQNKRGGDCGPVSVKLMEMHAFGFALSELTDKLVDNFRKSYAIDIHQRFVKKLV